MRYGHINTEAELTAFFLIAIPIAIGVFCGWLACNFLGDKTYSAHRTPKEHNIFWVVTAVVSVILILPAFHTICSPPETDENTAPGTLLIRAIGVVLVFVLARIALFVSKNIGNESPDLAVSVFARAFIGAFFLVFGAALLVFSDQAAAYINESCRFRTVTFQELDFLENFKAGFFGITASGAVFMVIAVISKPADKLLKTTDMAALLLVFSGSFLLARLYFLVARFF